MAVENSQRTVTTPDGVTLRVCTAAPAGALGTVPTVVLAHDLGLTHRSWDRVLEPLLRAGVRVVGWDQRGHGGSVLGVRHDRLAEMTVSDLGHDLQAVITAAVPPASPVVLVGHGIGGMAVMAHLADEPKLAQQRVAGVLLLSTGAYAVRLADLAPPSRVSRLLRRPAAPARPPVRAGGARVLLGSDPDPEVVHEVDDLLAQADPVVVREFYRALREADVRGAHELLRRRPVSILTGALDTVVPPTRTRAMTLTLTGARYAMLPDVGHLVPYEAPDRIVAEIGRILSVVQARMQSR